MSAAQRLAAIIAAGLVVLSGCSAPLPSPTADVATPVPPRPPSPDPSPSTAPTPRSMELAVCPSTRVPTPAPVAAPTAPGTVPTSLELVGQVGGSVSAVATDGDLAYVGVGSRLVVLDIADPSAIGELGAIGFQGAAVEDVVLNGDTAVVAAGGAGLHVVDITTPSRPRSVGEFPVAGYVEGVAALNGKAYVAAGPAGLLVLDLTDPAAPALVDTLPGPFYAFDVAVDGQSVYVAGAGAGMITAEVGDDGQLGEPKLSTTSGYAYGVAVTGANAYVADGWGGLRVLDVSDATEPILLATQPTAGWAMDVAVTGATVYVAEAGGGLQAIDVTDPGEPRGLGAVALPRGHPARLAVAGDTVLVADRYLGLQVIDVSDPARLELVGHHAPLGFADGIAVAGTSAYVAAGRFGLRVVDVSDASRPEVVGAIATQASAATVSIAGQAVYVTTLGQEEVLVANVPDGRWPTEAVVFANAGRERYSTPRNQSIAGSALYVAAENTLIVLEVSDPLSPCLLSATSLSGDQVPTLDDPSALGIAIRGDFAFLASELGGLLIMDVSDPRTPRVVGQLEGESPFRAGEPFAAQDVAVDGDTVYLLAGDHIQLIDVADPSRPRRVGFVPLPAYAAGWGPHLAPAGGVLYVADTDAGLLAIDVSDRTQPRLAARLRLPGRASAVAVEGRHVYVAAEDGGLVIVRPVAGTEASPPNALQSPRYVPPPAGSRAVAGEASPLDDGLVRPALAVNSAASRLTPAEAACTVTDPADDGPRTLRGCLAVLRPGGVVRFDPAVFPPHSPTPIRLQSGLAPLTGTDVTIDGSDAGVILDGRDTPAGTHGLELHGTGILIRGLGIQGFPGVGVAVGGRGNAVGGDRTRGTAPLGEGNVIAGNGSHGVLLSGEGGHVVRGNHIGLDAAGRVFGNGEDGVFIESGDNLVGGSMPGERNIVTGNGFSEIHMGLGWGSACCNHVQGNFVGTDASGTLDLSQGGYWTVAVEGGSPGNWIDGNVVTGRGILVFDEGSSYNHIVGNHVGVDVTGEDVLSDSGIFVNQSFNRIGGPRTGEPNVVNGFIGIVDGATDNIVAGNRVGTDPSGARAVGSGSIEISGRHNVVGGASVEEGNVIAGRGLDLFVGADHNFVAFNTVGTDPSAAAVFPVSGTSLSGASQNVLAHNFLGGGVRIHDSADGNLVLSNRITRGEVGVDVLEAAANIVAGNVIAGNALNARDAATDTRWDDGSRGNYWDDYAGTDGDDDAIGDTPHQVPPNGVDRYPLIRPP